MKDKLPTYRKVALELENRLNEGVYVSAQKLPSEYDLAADFDVSRLTVRKAIDYLIQKNLLYKLKGKGTYVMQLSEKVQSGKEGLVGFTESAKAYGKSSGTKVLLYDQTPKVAQKILDEMQLKDESELIYLERVRYFDEEPMTLENLYIRKNVINGATKEQLTGSLFGLIEQTTEIAYSHQEVEAVLATEKIAGLLDSVIGSPILKVNSIAYSATASPLIYDTSYYRADRYTFKNTLIRNR